MNQNRIEIGFSEGNAQYEQSIVIQRQKHVIFEFGFSFYFPYFFVSQNVHAKGPFLPSCINPHRSKDIGSPIIRIKGRLERETLSTPTKVGQFYSQH